MSELMDQAVIGMPYEMAMNDELSRRQFYSRAQSVLAEAQALRKQVKTLQSDANSWQSGYDEGRRMGTKHRQSEVEQLTRDVAALRARVVVVPDDLLQRCREILGWQKTGKLIGNALRNFGEARWPGDPNELQIAENETAREAYRFIDKLSRLNTKSISAETLRRIDLVLAALRSHDFHGIINSTIGSNWREQVAEMRGELRKLLDEGKESKS